jgi:hypothetical protein
MIRKLALTAMATLIATGFLAAGRVSGVQAEPAAKAKAGAQPAQAEKPAKPVTHRIHEPQPAQPSKAAPARKASGKLPARTERSTAPRTSRPVRHRGAATKGTTAGPTSSTPPTTPTR